MPNGKQQQGAALRGGAPGAGPARQLPPGRPAGGVPPGAPAPPGRGRVKQDVSMAAIRNVAETSNALMNEVGKAIVGKKNILENVLLSILADGHTLLEDFPGLAKSLMVMTFADALGCKYRRIQFTPDLLPSDITGTYIYDEKDNEFKFRPGPIFANIILADEINRAPPKTQAAMLEAMQERQVSIEGVTHKLPRPFIVMATQNPIEQEGTYPLPEAQVDRFMQKFSMGYPSREDEREILIRRMGRGKDQVDVNVVTSPEKIIQMQQTIEKVHLDPALLTYIVEVVTRTREDPRVVVGASPRGSLALFKLGRARAVLFGRDFITPDDIKAIAINALHHRIILKPEPRIRGVLAQDILNKIMAEVPVPAL
jgi:MoxR-like ATPase